MLFYLCIRLKIKRFFFKLEYGTYTKQNNSYRKNWYLLAKMTCIITCDLNIFIFVDNFYLSGTLLLNRHQHASIWTLLFCFTQFHTWTQGRCTVFILLFKPFCFYPLLYVYILFYYNAFQCLYHDKIFSCVVYNFVRCKQRIYCNKYLLQPPHPLPNLTKITKFKSLTT